MEVFELLEIDGGGGFHHEVGSFLGFGEGNHIANVFGVGEEHDDSVEAEANAEVRGCAIFERFNEETKTFFDLLFGELKELKHSCLELLVVDPLRSGAKLVAVEDEVVG